MLNSNHIINVGVIGVGYLGSFHVEQYQQIPGVRLVGCFDLDNKWVVPKLIICQSNNLFCFPF